MSLPWSRSITVSTSGFHPDNAGSTPAEITRHIKIAHLGIFFVLALCIIALRTEKILI